MSTIVREPIGTNHEKLLVKLHRKDFSYQIEKSLREKGKKADIPGYKKGQVPAAVIKKMFGLDVFKEELQKAAKKHLELFLEKDQLNYIGEPLQLPLNTQFSDDWDKTEEIIVPFEIGLPPEIDVKKTLENQTFVSYKLIASDEEINKTIYSLIEESTILEPKELINDDNDYLDLKFSKIIMGETETEEEVSETSKQYKELPEKLKTMLFEKKTDERFVFIPSLVADENFDIEKLIKTMEADANDANAPFYIKITAVNHKKTTGFTTEDYALLYGPEPTINNDEELRAIVKQEIELDKKQDTLQRLYTEIYEYLVHKTEMALPLKYLMRYLTLEGGYTKPESQVISEFPAFEHKLKWQIIAEHVIKTYNIEVTNQDIAMDILRLTMHKYGIKHTDNAPWVADYVVKAMKDEKLVTSTYQRVMSDKLFSTLGSLIKTEEQIISDEDFGKLGNVHEMYHQH